MIDGVHFADSCCVVALGIDIEGTKHPLGLVEGSTEINAFIHTGITNARTEGYNRLVKQVKRAGCGRNKDNSTRRIRFHCTRKQWAATQTSCRLPGQS